MINRRHFLLYGSFTPWSKLLTPLIGLPPILLHLAGQAHAANAGESQCWLSMNLEHAIPVKDGELFFVCRPDGSVPADGGQGHGLFYHDCRYLSAYHVTIADKPLRPYGADPSSGYGMQVVLTNEPFTMDSGRSVRDGLVLLASECILDGATQSWYERLNVRNVSQQDLAFALKISLQAEFESIYGLRGKVPKQLGTPEQPSWQDDTIWFRYEGSDGTFRALVIMLDPPPTTRESHAAGYAVHLKPDETRQITLICRIAESKRRADLDRARDPLPALDDVRNRRRQEQRDWEQVVPTVLCDNPVVNRVIAASMRDVHMLKMTMEDETILAAGVPWFVGLFGRDSLVAALQVQAYAPGLSGGILRLLSRYQGRRDTGPPHDEQPGKILHELRVGESAGSGRIAETPYYGAIDSTLWYVITLASYLNWTGDLGLFQELRTHLDAALTWMELFGDRHGEDFVRYSNAPGDQLANKGWKDSGKAIVNADGSKAEPPIALVTAQGYAYRAKELIAALFDRTGDRTRAGRLRDESSRLRQRFNKDFWVPAIDFYAMALQKDDKPAAVISSNPGQALWSGIVDDGRAKTVAARLMKPDMFSGWGIRTLSSQERTYSPISYERGSVWPFDSAFCAAGLKRYGFDEAACRIFDGIVDAASHFALHRLPELFCGFARDEYRVPIPHPHAEHPQAWSAGAVPYLLTELLGLRPSALDGKLDIVRPVLPSSIQRLDFRRLHVGSGQVDLRFTRRADGHAEVKVITVDGPVDVRVVESCGS
ncbi:MAG TPA: glycogen debranching N-terminal domain-containing protein [Nitrospira sp.]|nr:glycogen debranching N-terminal domain-containing protein [Nitrospira sp.]